MFVNAPRLAKSTNIFFHKPYGIMASLMVRSKNLSNFLKEAYTVAYKETTTKSLY